MFKKPLGNLKTSAPLRNSDRRKLKQHIIQTFSLDPDVGEELVPDGLLSVKFKTHTDEPGVSESRYSSLSLITDPQNASR